MKKMWIIVLLVLLVFSMFLVERMETAAQGQYRHESAGKSSFGLVEQPFQAVAEDPQLFAEAIGGQGLDFGRSVAQTPTGDFVVTGPWSYSGGTYSDLSLIYLDASGNPLCGGILKGSTTNNKFETGCSVIAPNWLEFTTGNVIEETEPNDNHLAADNNPVITLGDTYGTPQNTAINPGGDRDYVKFSSKAGTVFSAIIMTAPGALLKPRLTLYDHDGTTPLCVAESTTISIFTMGTLQFTIREDGNYYLAVSGTGTGGYSLSTKIHDVIVVGHSNSFSQGFNAIIARFSSSSTFRWAKRLSPPAGATTFGLSVTDTGDQGFVMTGPIWNHPNGQGMDFYIVKFDASGNLQWSTVVVGNGDDCGSSVIEASDGDLVVTGWTTSSPSGPGSMNVLLVRFNAADGSVQWAKAYDGNNGQDCGESVIEESSISGYRDLYVVGATNSFDAGNEDLLLARFTEDGNPVWANTLGGNDDDHGCSLVRTWCGGNHIPVPSPPAPAEGLCDFGIAVTGSTKSFGMGGQDLLVAMFDLDGNCKWAKTIDRSVEGLNPGTANDGGFSLINAYSSILPPLDREMVQTNCRLVFAGYTFSWGRGGEDILFGTFDYYGNTARDNKAAAQVGHYALSQCSACSFTQLTPSLVSAAPILPTDAVVQAATPIATTICTTEFTQFTDVGPSDQPVVFEFAVIADTHLRYGTNPPYNQLWTVVQRINEAVNAGEDIRFVMVLGDIGDEGYRCRSSPYAMVKAVLDELLVPYVPVIGNHEVWYDDNAGQTVPDRNHPEWFEGRQEEIFNKIFSLQYNYLGTCCLANWIKEPTPINARPPSAPSAVDNYFQNFAFDYMRYHFICLDWNNRNEIYTSDLNQVTPMSRGYPDLQHWAPGGTLEWLLNHLLTYDNKGDENVLLFAHHSLSFVASKNDASPYLPYHNTFSSTQYSEILDELTAYWPNIDKWFAGHWHVSDGDSSYNGDHIFQYSEESITDDYDNNIGAHILTDIVTRSVSSLPVSPGENIRLVRVHDYLDVNFTYDPPRPMAGASVTFTDHSVTTSGNIIYWQWDFGDGSPTYTGANPPPHPYPNTGIYKVTLTVETDTGLKGSISKAIDVGIDHIYSTYPTATAYNNGRKLVCDPEDGTLHLVYTTGPGQGSLTYANSEDEGNTWFEVTPGLMWGGYPALDLNTFADPCVVGTWAGIGSGFNARRRESPSGWFSYDGISDLDAFGYPSAVVDSDNYLHVVVSYQTPTSSEIRYYVMSPGGKVFLGPETVVSSTTDVCSSPSITLVRRDCPLVVWQQGSKIYRSWRYRRDWQNPPYWNNGAPPTQISDPGAVYAKTPSIVANSTTQGARDNASVTWQEYDGVTTKVVYAELLSWTTWTPYPAIETLSTLSSADVDSYPQVAFEDNVVCVVWANKVTLGDYDIFYCRKTGTESWSNPANLSNSHLVRSQHPQAAIIPGATPVLCVVWTEGNGSPYEIRSSANIMLKTDINGDGKVNILDVSTAARAFGSHGPDIPNLGDPPSDRWNAIADLNKDGWVNIIDISMIAVDFGKPH